MFLQYLSVGTESNLNICNELNSISMLQLLKMISFDAKMLMLLLIVTGVIFSASLGGKIRRKMCLE